MRFAAPYLLLCLLAVPPVVLGYRIIEARRARRSFGWSRRAMLPNILRRPPRRLTGLPPLLFLLGLVFLLVAFARPQRVLGSVSGGAPIVVLAFDVSGSMAATDVRPTRLAAARGVARQFLRELPPSYQVAVLTFGDKVRLAVPPTLDRQEAVAGLPAAITRLAGTSIGDGIASSIATIVAGSGGGSSAAPVHPGAVLLLSDGAQTAGGVTLEQAAISALVDYVPIDTVAIGTPKGTVTQPATYQGVKTTTQIPVPAQPSALRRVSQQTGGSFFDLAAARSPGSLRSVYGHLAPGAIHDRRIDDLSAAATGVALVLVLSGIALSGLWFGRVA